MKKLLLILTLVLVLFTLTSCHGSQSETKIPDDPIVIPETFDTSKQITISFWAKNDSNKTQKEVYYNAISSFESYYPNIHVNISDYDDYMKIHNDVITTIPTHTTPNVAIAYPDNVSSYLSGHNVVAELDSYINNSKYGLGGSDVLFDSVSKDEVVTKFFDECIINGSTYMIPYMRSSECLYINKDYVESLGYTIPEIPTWDWIWEVCEKAMAENPKGHTLIPLIYKSTDNMAIQACYQLGINYIDASGNVYLFKEDKLSEYLLDIQSHAIKKEFSTFKRDSYPGNSFNIGQCIFAIDSTAGATWMGSDHPSQDAGTAGQDKYEFETVVRVIPQYDPDNVLMISQGPSMCMFYDDDPDVMLASWLFMQFMLTNEVQISYAETEGYVPVTFKAIDSVEYKAYLANSGTPNIVNDAETGLYYDVKIAATRLVLNNINSTFITPVFDGSIDVRNAAGQLIEYAFNKKYQGQDKINQLYYSVKTLYNIDDSITDGQLPTFSKVLIVSLSVCWAGVITAFIIQTIKDKKKKKYRRKDK